MFTSTTTEQANGATDPFPRTFEAAYAPLASSTLSETTARRIWDAWHELRPHSRTELATMQKIAKHVRSAQGDVPLKLVTVQNYAQRLGLTTFGLGIKGTGRGHIAGKRPPGRLAQAVTTVAQGQLSLQAMRTVLELVETVAAAKLSPEQRTLLVRWIIEDARNA